MVLEIDKQVPQKIKKKLHTKATKTDFKRRFSSFNKKIPNTIKLSSMFFI